MVVLYSTPLLQYFRDLTIFFMILACWNVRGLNKRSHQKEVIKLLNKNGVSLVGLVETKVKAGNFNKVISRLNKN